MYIQIVTFRLNGITEEQYQQACQGETDAFNALPGLLSKILLRNPDTNTFGGIYLWRDRASHDSYLNGEIFRSIQNDTSRTEVQSWDFDVFEDLTKATQPGLAVI